MTLTTSILDVNYYYCTTYVLININLVRVLASNAI